MVVDAVRAVMSKEPYASRLTLEVHQLESPEGKWAESRYPFGAERHGFVVVTRAGELRACRPSHFYGESEVKADFDRVMRGRLGHMPK